MTHILLSEATYNAAMYPGTRLEVSCPKCKRNVRQFTKYSTGAVEYICSCGAVGMVTCGSKAVAR